MLYFIEVNNKGIDSSESMKSCVSQPSSGVAKGGRGGNGPLRSFQKGVC